MNKSKKNQPTSKKPKKSKNNILIWSLVSAAVLLFLIGFVSNVIPFTYNVIRCGKQPVESSKFAAAWSYKLPGDYGYGIHLFSDYRFCTEIEAQSGGYHRANKYGTHKYEE